MYVVFQKWRSFTFATSAPSFDKNNRHTSHTVSRSAIIFQAENAAPVDIAIILRNHKPGRNSYKLCGELENLFYPETRKLFSTDIVKHLISITRSFKEYYFHLWKSTIYTGWGTVTCWFQFGAKRLEVEGERWSWYHWKGDTPKFCFSLGSWLPSVGQRRNERSPWRPTFQMASPLLQLNVPFWPGSIFALELHFPAGSR